MKGKTLLAALLTAASLAGLCLMAGTVPPAGEKEPFRAVDMLKCNYYSEKDFRLSINQADRTGADATLTAKGAIRGGIVPHHLLAGRMIADFFNVLAADRPELVVVLAPNHKRVGMTGLHTSSLDWETPFGILEADGSAAALLQEKLKAADSRPIMEAEYSISGLVPYIKHYLPEARILPVLLHGDYGMENSEKLGRLLAESLRDKKAVVVASVDFSHYLPVGKADRMDEITLQALKSMDAERISRMSNDNLDSPPSVIALLAAMKAMGAKDFNLLGHNNSSRITGSGADYTTSYFTAAFTR
jgi:AmmeMemoRadiSam system protein B